MSCIEMLEFSGFFFLNVFFFRCVFLKARASSLVMFFMLSMFQDQSPNRSFDGSSGLSGLMSAVEPVVLNHSHAEFNGR